MASGFKKPTAVIRDAKVKLYKAVGADVPDDPRRGFTDRMEFLSPTVLISYKTAPNDPTKAAILAGTRKAQEIIRIANDRLAGVMMLRKAESAAFQEIMEAHFGLIEGDNVEIGTKADGSAKHLLKGNKVNNKFSLRSFGKKDRRWVLEKIRQQFLSISFHLNTGVHLIDADDSHRDIRVGDAATPGNKPNEEAYVGAAKTKFGKGGWKAKDWDFKGGLLAGFQNGEIHVAFDKIAGYSDISFARVIIHEATHKYLNTDDHAYAHSDKYATLNLLDTLNNADSLAWAAVSLYCGALKMGSPAVYDTDWAQCTV